MAIQAYLFRSEDDCRALAAEGSRVRLVKGAYAEPASVAHQGRTEVDKAYVRCLRILMAGKGYPMVATHDDRMISITELLADRYGRARGDYEYQMLYGIRTDRQQALAGAGHTRPRLRPLRRRLVRLLHAPPGRAPRQRRLLPSCPWVSK